MFEAKNFNTVILVTGQASAIPALLANIAFRAGRELQSDASNERFA
jgi:hypothetical protein